MLEWLLQTDGRGRADPKAHARGGDLPAWRSEGARMVRRPWFQEHPAILYRLGHPSEYSRYWPSPRSSSAPLASPTGFLTRVAAFGIGLRDACGHHHRPLAAWLLYELERQPAGRRLRVPPPCLRDRYRRDHHGWWGVVGGWGAGRAPPPASSPQPAKVALMKGGPARCPPSRSLRRTTAGCHPAADASAVR